MAKKKKTNPSKKQPQQHKTTKTPSNQPKDQENQHPILQARKTDAKTGIFVFGRQNYILLLLGLAFILVGFLLMIGGGSDDPTVFNEEIFSPRRMTIAPILVITGYIIEIFAILRRPKH